MGTYQHTYIRELNQRKPCYKQAIATIHQMQTRKGNRSSTPIFFYKKEYFAKFIDLYIDSAYHAPTS